MTVDDPGLGTKVGTDELSAYSETLAIRSIRGNWCQVYLFDGVWSIS